MFLPSKFSSHLLKSLFNSDKEVVILEIHFDEVRILKTTVNDLYFIKKSIAKAITKGRGPGKTGRANCLFNVHNGLNNLRTIFCTYLKSFCSQENLVFSQQLNSICICTFITEQLGPSCRMIYQKNNLSLLKQANSNCTDPVRIHFMYFNHILWNN